MTERLPTNGATTSTDRASAETRDALEAGTKEAFRAAHPNTPFLSADDLAGAEAHLRRRKVIDPDESIIRLGPAGEGNMNCTLRVTTRQRSLILKQSRPWVEKYPTIAAPWDRIRSEARFYELTAATETVANHMPSVLDFDPQARALVLDDLGDARDFTCTYRDKQLASHEIAELAKWLSALHHLEFDATLQRTLENRAMRVLNHEHIFRLPLNRDNGLDLDAITPGLRDVADRLAGETAYVGVVRQLGCHYLSNDETLIHGDFFPGSWLAAGEQIRVIDPEFAFFGRPEFDVGVFLAHLLLGGQGDRAVETMWRHYAIPTGFQRRLTLQFAGIEIMRRLIGVAQLPLDFDLDQKTALLRQSQKLVAAPEP